MSWGTVEIPYLRYGFYNAINLEELPNQEFSLTTINAEHCFENCKKLLKLPDNFYFNDIIKNISYMFKCSGLTTLNNLHNDFIIPINLLETGMIRFI